MEWNYKVDFILKKVLNLIEVHVCTIFLAVGLRPDAGPQVGYLHGQLCQWRGLLPLLLLRAEGLQQGHTC